ncbi:type II toxin-antitoxin system RelE/ParE family toxin [Nitrospirillum iridis]|uniref:Phage-related protein n=1 Tax=Nitrospirillum iridis TaxID=765888 RepID=A0A7X0AWX2_9PROT|nr:type II toxin-antitoxin system RelE/ParE family toxin [Nitrospirillum iridis]MBB6251614.1 phage-related protein [Nitrospirillum iridis]
MSASGTTRPGDPKDVEFLGDSLEALRGFPLAAKREAGHQIDNIQHGRLPDDWKPMKTVGPGVQEIRINNQSGIYRVIYVAKFEDAVYVLHCFQKKSRKTDPADIGIAKDRYGTLVERLKRHKADERKGKPK